MRSSRRASYATRTAVDGAGTVLTEADLGTGVDTIRPVKKVDGAGSLRLSSEFVGSIRKDGSMSSRSPTVHKRASSETARAGRSLVEDVVLPILGQVRYTRYHSLQFPWLTHIKSKFTMTWMLGRSSL